MVSFHLPVRGRSAAFGSQHISACECVQPTFDLVKLSIGRSRKIVGFQRMRESLRSEDRRLRC